MKAPSLYDQKKGSFQRCLKKYALSFGESRKALSKDE